MSIASRPATRWRCRWRAECPAKGLRTFRVQSQFVQRPFWQAYALAVAYFASVAGFAAVVNVVTGALGVVSVVVLSITVGIVIANASTRVALGTDGLLMSWLLWWRFVSYGDIESLAIRERRFNATRQRALVVALRGGDELLFAVGVEKSAVVDSLERAVDRARRVLNGALRPILPDVEDDDMPDALFGALERASFRSKALGRDEVWELVENGGVSPKTRAMGVALLMAELTEEERRRLEELAARLANPRLRAVLDAGARGTRFELERTMRKLLD